MYLCIYSFIYSNHEYKQRCVTYVCIYICVYTHGACIPCANHPWLAGKSSIIWFDDLTIETSIWCRNFPASHVWLREGIWHTHIYIYSHPGVDRVCNCQKILTKKRIPLKIPFSIYVLQDDRGIISLVTIGIITVLLLILMYISKSCKIMYISIYIYIYTQYILYTHTYGGFLKRGHP